MHIKKAPLSISIVFKPKTNKIVFLQSIKATINRFDTV